MPRIARDKIIAHRHRHHHRRIPVPGQKPRVQPNVQPNVQLKVEKKDTSQITKIKNLASKIALQHDGKKHIILTVGNLGYMSLLTNWWLSLNKNTNLAKHSLILTFDDILVDNLKKKLPFCNACYLPYTISKTKPSTKAVSFKKNDWDGITRFKLKAIHHLIEWGYTVYYVDPDVYVINNSLPRFSKLIKDETQLLIQQGNPFCSGVIYAPSNDVTKKLFSPDEWLNCGMDDEHYIQHYFTQKYPKLRHHVHVLSLERFPNGLKWKHDYTVDRVWESIKNKNIDLLHFNYISGIEHKISRMRKYKMWHTQMTIVTVPRYFQEDLNDICLRKNKSVYPPHQSGPQIEKHTYDFMSRYLKDHTISSDYDYLPIFWTSISLNDNDSHIMDKLKTWLKNFIKRYPNRKCWTVVQHCKGIQRTCRLVLPKNWLIFSTSDPNAIKLHQEIKSINDITTVNFIPIQKRKMMYWQKTGFGRQAERPPDRHIDRKNRRHIRIPENVIETVDNNPSPLKENKHLKFYTKNHISIPLLSSTHKASFSANWTGKRRMLASFIGNMSVHPIRGLMQESLSKRNRVCIEPGKYKFSGHINQFDKLMLNSTFALCPRGYGNTSFRLVEAMQFGTIPVYISDVFTLPYSDKIDWDKIAVLIRPDQFPKMYTILKDLESDQTKIDEYRKNIKEMMGPYFTMDGCCNNMIRYVVA